MPDARVPKHRWYHLTPDRLVFLLLVIVALLWLSEGLGWPAWDKGYAVLAALACVGAGMLLMLAWFFAGLLFRWRFQFSIRSLLVLVVVVAVPCSWTAIETKKAREQKEAVQHARKLAGRVRYDYMSEFEYGYQQFANPLSGSDLPGAAWLGDLLGPDFFATVVGLEFSDCWSLTDVDLEHLKGLTQLRTLNLHGTQVTDAGLERLKGLTQLQELYLDGTQVTDAGLERLKGLTQLQELYLDGTKVTGVGLEYLKGLAQLKTLGLYGAPVTDAGLQHLKGLGQLQALGLSGRQVTDAGLEHLKGLSRLQTLGLWNTKVTDKGLKHLKGLTQLRELDLWDTEVTDTGLEHLKGLTQLQRLNLDGTQVTDLLEHLQGLTQLRWLNLGDTHITDAGLVHLKRLTQLQWLDLRGTQVTYVGVKWLQQVLPNCHVVPAESLKLRPIPPQATEAGKPVVAAVTVENPQQWKGKLRFSLGPDAPHGAKIDPQSGKFCWTSPPNCAAIAEAVAVSVEGPAGQRDQMIFGITVTRPISSGRKDLTVDLGGRVKLELVLIPAGGFWMGSPYSEGDVRPFDRETPQHQVRITKPFFLGKYPVTQEQWETVMGTNPSRFKGPKNPVENVSWDDCQAFLRKLNAKKGEHRGNFILPTEAQWEYACRAGSTTRYYFGDDVGRLGEYAWYDMNSSQKTHPVGEKKPNAWGLYDMLGNVGQWCLDDTTRYGGLLAIDPTGPTMGLSRASRGRSWSSPARHCRCAARDQALPDYRNMDQGFRVARVPNDK